jgi:hypothetical protein
MRVAVWAVLAAIVPFTLAANTGAQVRVGSGARIEIAVTEWAFTPSTIILEEGRPVTIVFINNGRLPHALASSYLNNQTLRLTGQFTEGVYRPDNWRFVQAAPGQRYEMSFSPRGRPREGQVVFICSMADGRHAAAGLTGAFIIKAGSP